VHHSAVCEVEFALGDTGLRGRAGGFGVGSEGGRGGFFEGLCRGQGEPEIGQGFPLCLGGCGEAGPEHRSHAAHAKGEVGGGTRGAQGDVEGVALVRAGHTAQGAVHLIAQGDGLAGGLSGTGTATGAVDLALRRPRVEGHLAGLERSDLVHQEIDHGGRSPEHAGTFFGSEAIEDGVGARGERDRRGEDAGRVDRPAVLQALRVVEGEKGELARRFGDGCRPTEQVVEGDGPIAGERCRRLGGGGFGPRDRRAVGGPGVFPALHGVQRRGALTDSSRFRGKLRMRFPRTDSATLRGHDVVVGEP